ncbi:MAG: hypothetical protein WA060_01845 [Minisyncoccia bacterium]
MRRFKSARFLFYPIVTVVFLFTGFLIYSGVKLGTSAVSSWWSEKEEEETKPPDNKPTSTYYHQPTEALVLMHECYTPCSTQIAWSFKIRTEGRPLRITFSGVRDSVSYPGEGDFRAPSQMRSGETFFDSPDKKNPHVRVQVYRKVNL